MNGTKDFLIKRLIEILKRAANNSCCLCCDKCLSCDAEELLRELKGEKPMQIIEEAISALSIIVGAIERLDPNAANNNILIEINKILGLLKGL